jgi:catechol 2,3-dioxygenase-like lactoylglutathione lyase family enzyme
MRKVAGELAHGYFLSDGATNMAVLKFRGPDQLGKGLDYTGLHHFGLLVDDVKEWTARLESMGAECFMRAPERPGNNHFEVKFRGPDGVVFDIAQHPWPGSAAIEVEPAETATAG